MKGAAANISRTVGSGIKMLIIRGIKDMDLWLIIRMNKYKRKSPTVRKKKKRKEEEPGGNFLSCRY